MAEERKGTTVQKWDEVNGADSMGMDAPYKDGEARSQGERFKELRSITGMNRKDFATYLGIPYNTMTDWELNQRHMPNYVFALIEYKVKNEFGGNPQIKINDPNSIGNVMRGVEDQLEQNDNQLDGIINNGPREAEVEREARESVLKKLKDCIEILEEEKKRQPVCVHCEAERT